MTYPSGRLIEYPSLDRAGRVLKVQGTLAGTTTEYAKSVTYNASGQMSSLTFGNNLIERWDYNPRRLQPWQIRLGTDTVDDARGRWQFGYCAGLNYNQDCASNKAEFSDWNPIDALRTLTGPQCPKGARRVSLPASL